MGGWVDGHFDILLKPPQPFTGLFLLISSLNQTFLTIPITHCTGMSSKFKLVQIVLN